MRDGEEKRDPGSNSRDDEAHRHLLERPIIETIERREERKLGEKREDETRYLVTPHRRSFAQHRWLSNFGGGKRSFERRLADHAGRSKPLQPGAARGEIDELGYALLELPRARREESEEDQIAQDHPKIGAGRY